MSLPTSRARTSASITDVARLAGVSAQTVSRVATGSPRVSDSTRGKVQRAMDQLGYTPNLAARALRRGTYGAIGLLGHNFSRTGEVLTMRGVLAAAGSRGYSVNVLNVTHGTTDEWNSAVRRLPERAIDALIVIRAELVQPGLISLPDNLPVVVNGTWPGAPHPTVAVDQVAGITLAVEHLLTLGHRTVHHISGPLGSEVAQIRAATWQQVLASRGIASPPVIVGDWSAASGYRAASQVLDLGEVTAVCCTNDETAIGLMQGLHQAGVSVPDQISVIGFDDVDLAEYTVPALTTIVQDFRGIGEISVQAVLAEREAMAAGGAASRQRIRLAPTLKVRASTAPPPSPSLR